MSAQVTKAFYFANWCPMGHNEYYVVVINEQVRIKMINSRRLLLYTTQF